jgi:TonB family protein
VTEKNPARLTRVSLSTIGLPQRIREKIMLRITNGLCGIALCLLVLTVSVSAQSNLTARARNTPGQPVNAPVESDRTRDGLVGPVRRVRTEVAKITSAGGGQQEGKHITLEIVAYDLKGNKIENQYFPIVGATLTGKEVYKYDEKGNISEMTMLNGDGSLLSKEIYKYEFDFAGNWNKMTTSVAVVDGGRLTFEPTEVTYRSIMYYLDENMLKSVQPAATATTQPVVSAPANVVTPPANAANKPTVEPKPKSNSAANRTKANSAIALPAATATANKVTSTGPVEIKTVDTDSNQNVQPDALDSEPPPPIPRPILKPVSGGVLNGTAITLPPPVYPEAAKRMRTSGVVSIDVVLDEAGKVVSAIATSGPAILRDSAVQAALKARFSPTKLSGQPVKVSGVINYKFALVQ